MKRVELRELLIGAPYLVAALTWQAFADRCAGERLERRRRLGLRLIKGGKS